VPTRLSIGGPYPVYLSDAKLYSGGAAMSAKVSLFAPVSLGKFKYLFFIVGWTDYSTPLKDELAKQLDAFGADLGTSGMVLQPYRAHEFATFNEVLEKNWPTDFRDRLEAEVDPCMLIIDRDFDAFDPKQDRWAVIWFSDLREVYAQELAHLFHKLALLSRQERDLLQYLKRLVLRHEVQDAAKLGRLTKYFDLGKPEFFGISVDVQAIVTDVIGAITDRRPHGAV
jgi:hypothetical protein